MNTINLYGKVLKKNKLIQKEDGTTSIRFMLVSKRNRSKDIDLLPCFATGKNANIINDFVSEKDRLVVMGSINTWSVGEENEKKYCWHIYVSGVEFVEYQNERETEQNNTDNDGFEYPTEEEMQMFVDLNDFEEFSNEY